MGSEMCIRDRFDTISKRLSDLPILRSVGVLSFLIYLLHVPIMHALRWGGGTFQLGSKEGIYALMVIGSITVSWMLGLLVHRFLEVPTMKSTSRLATHPAAIFMTYAYTALLVLAMLFALAVY